VDFDNEKDAEDCREALNGKGFNGTEINIEWSKKSGRADGRDSKRPTR
jgi:RNA recognition motif-containing protein